MPEKLNWPNSVKYEWPNPGEKQKQLTATSSI